VAEPVAEVAAEDAAAEAVANTLAEAVAAPVAAPVATPVATPVAEPVAPPPARRAADTVPDPVPAALAAAHAALDFGSLEAAEMLITESRWLGADETAMGELELRLDTLRESLRRERQALLLALGRERIRSGWFTVPETDSAVHYLASLRAENPAYPGLSETVWELTPRLVDDVRGSIAAGDWAAAEVGLDKLRRVGAPEGITAPLAVEVDVTRRQHEYLRVPAAPEEMELLRTRTPIYPRVAVRNEFEGWVDLEFIVDREGAPRDLAIVGEQPDGVFSRAATEAVERYRYAPFVRDGVTYERLVRVRVVFALD
jgi:TonB family protein